MSAITDHITVYLGRATVSKDQVLSDYAKDASRASRHTVEVSSGVSATLVIARGKTSYPGWAPLFSEATPVIAWPTSQALGAALVLEVDGRTWLLTFGTLGRHMVDREHIVHRFGLRVAVNLMSEDSVRRFESQVFDRVLRRVAQSTGVDAKSDNFAIDFDSDLVKAVGGRPMSAVAAHVEGTDRLALWGEYRLSEFPAVLRTLLEAYESTAYLDKGFAWIDHFQEITSQEEIVEIEEIIDAILRGDEVEGVRSVELAIPDEPAFRSAVKFCFDRRSGHHLSLRLRDLLQAKGPVTCHDLRSMKLLAIAEDGVEYPVPIYRCLVGEVTPRASGRAAGTVVVSGGHFYRMATDWVLRVDKDVSEMEPFIGFPFYDHASENAWCATAVSALGPKRWVADRSSIVHFGGGRSQIEFCDMFDGHYMVFAKRYSGFGSTSYLFGQVRASVEGWFRHDAGYRRKVNDALPPELQLPNPSARPDPSRYTVLIAIIGAPKILPFLSRVALRQLVQELRDRGIEVMIADVPQSPVTVAAPAPRRRSRSASR